MLYVINIFTFSLHSENQKKEKQIKIEFIYSSFLTSILLSKVMSLLVVKENIPAI